jgi:cytochrome b561
MTAMTVAAPTPRYKTISIALHWLMLLLFVGVYTSIEIRSNFPRGSDIREFVKATHFTLGLTILALVVARIAARLMNPVPPITPAPPVWQARFAGLVHILLYGLMIGSPIAGWLILSGEGASIPFWGLELPPLIGPNKDFAKQVEELHETAGSIGYWVIGLHALAALFHHYIMKDDTLRRILPWRS